MGSEGKLEVELPQGQERSVPHWGHGWAGDRSTCRNNRQQIAEGSLVCSGAFRRMGFYVTLEGKATQNSLKLRIGTALNLSRVSLPCWLCDSSPGAFWVHSFRDDGN